jgi:hypothetical protein
MRSTTNTSFFTRIKKTRLLQLTMLMLGVLTAGSASAQTWSAMPGGGMNGWVYATTVYNGDLIVGGLFTTAGGVPANYIARWDGTTWTSLGSGLNGKVNALAVFNGNLVVAGEFTSAGGIGVNFIAQWNDATGWDDELGGVGSTVTSLAVIGTDLYVGGYFTDGDGTPANYIAMRNNTGWHALGSGMNSQVMGLTVHNGELYAGGFFTTAGGLTANHIAKWNGTTWSALGSGINNIVYVLSEYNGNLIAGGLFGNAGGVAAGNIASWNGTAWSALGGGMGGVFYQYVFALAVYNNHLIAGGYFTTSEGITTNGMASWDGTSWSEMGGGLFYPANVYGAHSFCLYGQDLMVGGLFTSAGGVQASHIAKWNEPMTPVTLNVQNDILPNGTTTCYNATQTITVAGGATTFLVQNGGSATMIAGHNILYLPGTKIDSGGYLNGYITTTGQYCAPPAGPVVLDPGIWKDVNSAKSGLAKFKVYPNPSSGKYSLEVNSDETNAKVEIFSMHGDKVSTFTIDNGTIHPFSLSDHPAGIYYLRLISATKVETAVVVKRN